MKKKVLTIVAALVALAVCAVALANTAAVELYDRAVELLFETSNVTLKAHVEFKLDGAWFKTMDGEWKQDGDRTFRQLLLSSPKKDGTERKNGYTIVTEQNDLYLMEVVNPGYFRRGFVPDRNSLLRNTVETMQLTGLGRILASQADLLLGSGAVAKTDGGSWRVAIGEDAPEMVSAALNEAVRFIAKRYFLVDFDRIKPAEQVSLYSHLTVTQGILNTMQGISVKKAEITVKEDGQGNLALAEGSIALNVVTAQDGVKQLDITFRVEAGDRGTTMLKKFDPKDYNAQLAYQYEPAFELGMEAGMENPEMLQLAYEDEMNP